MFMGGKGGGMFIPMGKLGQGGGMLVGWCGIIGMGGMLGGCDILLGGCDRLKKLPTGGMLMSLGKIILSASWKSFFTLKRNYLFYLMFLKIKCVFSSLIDQFSLLAAIAR